jgi:hypothetical protein
MRRSPLLLVLLAGACVGAPDPARFERVDGAAVDGLLLRRDHALCEPALSEGFYNKREYYRCMAEKGWVRR